MAPEVTCRHTLTCTSCTRKKRLGNVVPKSANLKFAQIASRSSVGAKGALTYWGEPFFVCENVPAVRVCSFGQGVFDHT